MIFINLIELTEKEAMKIVCGEAITIAGIMAILIISIIAVIAYRIFMSSKGSAQIPGGFKFSWS